MTIEQNDKAVWRCLDCFGTSHDGLDTLALHMRNADIEYTVTVTAPAPLMTGAAIDALRAAQAHIHKAVGAPLPAGARLPEDGEVIPACPSSKSVN